MPPDGPEVNARRELRKAFDTEWPASQAVISGSSSIEPLVLEICQKGEDGKVQARQTPEVFKDSISHMERKYKISQPSIKLRDQCNILS